MSYSVSDKVRSVMAAVLQQWPHAQIDTRDPTGVWSNAVDGLSAEQIRYAIRKFSDETSSFAITPGQFKALAKSAPDIPKRPAITRQVDNSERGKAFAACKLAYCHIVCGTTPRESAQKYRGTFDYKAVARAAPKPKDSSFAAHERAWDRLFELFANEWDAWEAKQ